MEYDLKPPTAKWNSYNKVMGPIEQIQHVAEVAWNKFGDAVFFANDFIGWHQLMYPETPINTRQLGHMFRTSMYVERLTKSCNHMRYRLVDPTIWKAKLEQRALDNSNIMGDTEIT